MMMAKNIKRVIEKKLKEQEKVKAETKRREKKERAYMTKIKLANKKMDYIRNLINGRYYLARNNMIAEQVLSNKILEKIDGAPKSEEYMRAELALMRMQGITSMRTAYFAKQDLLNDFGFTEDEITVLENDYYNGKIIRDEYDESDKRKNKAEFVKDTQ